MKAETLPGQRVFRVERLIGREAEKRNLDAALSRAVRFEAPQFVSVIGAAGIGKSRLCAEWLQAVDEGGQFQAFFTHPRPSASGTPEAFSLFGSLLRARLGIAPEDDEATAQAILGRELQAVFGDRRVSELAALLSPLVGLPAVATPLSSSLAVRQDQRMALARAVLCRFLEEDGRKQPLLFVVDDAHLADDESLALIAQLSAELGETCVVFVLAARPELLLRRPEWNHVEGSHVRMEMGPLAPLEVQVFVQSALGSETEDPRLVEQAVAESGGNPALILRLLARYSQEGILAGGAGAPWVFDGERALHVELTLGEGYGTPHRLAKLPSSAREILRRAACVGPVFWTGALVTLGRMAADPWDPTLVFAPDPSIEEIKRLLDTLVEAGFLSKDTENLLPCDTAWSFVDTSEMVLLATEVAPDLLRRRKRFAAQWIEARTPEPRTCDQAEVIARLYEEGADPRRAGRRYVAAGDVARRAQGHERARALYGKAVKLLDADDALLALDTLHRAGDVCARLGRSREALAHFGEMLKIAWRLDLPGKAGAAHGRIGRIHRALGDYPLSLQHLDMAHLLFDLAGDRPGVAASLDDIGRVHYLMGKPEEALRFHKTALSIRTELKDERGLALTWSWIGLVEAQMGELGMAQKSFEQSLALSQAKRDAARIVFSLLDLGSLAHEAGHPALARNLMEQARGLARHLGEPLHECHLALQIGAAWLAQGELAEAERELVKAKDIAQKFGARRLLAEADLALAERELRAGNRVYAQHHARQAVEAAERMGAIPLAGAALRILAQALAGGEEGMDRVEARECFERSLTLLAGCHAALELSRTFAAYAAFEAALGREDSAERLRDRSMGIRRQAGIEGMKKAPTEAAVDAQA